MNGQSCQSFAKIQIANQKVVEIVFNENSTISEIAKHPVINDIARFVFPNWDYNTLTFEGRERFWENPETTLNHIGKLFPTWRVASVVDGINYLYTQFANHKGRLFHIWNEQDIANQPDLAEVVLFHFPAKAYAHSIIICPGGGYEAVCSIAEGFSMAKILNYFGYNVFILKYRTYPHAEFLKPQDDLAKSISFISEHAKKLRIDPKSYSVCGFSAGGHLAASWGTANMGYSKYNLQAPRCLILAYPVITMGEKAHAGSRRSLIGDDPSETRTRTASIEMQITTSYPPTYIWHCIGDDTVDYSSNSEAFVHSLTREKIKFEFLPVDSDLHGVGTGIGTPAEGWISKAVTFLESI